ncbi:hypothetical protein JB92DRAFT_3105497 [Gautieria morchelliformis]|nr:hypothetical protein JB92DRAFT_3105497 [Gautieria morchelliformis]
MGRSSSRLRVVVAAVAVAAAGCPALTEYRERQRHGEEHAPHRGRRAGRDAARDLLYVYSKLMQVLYPCRAGSAREALRDWDLWGPLILYLLLGVMLSVNAPQAQSLGVFTGVIIIVSVCSLVVTIQAKLLSGCV